MDKELFFLAGKIKAIREQMGMTQAALAKRLGLTRASINSWEMGLSVPSTQYIAMLAKIFGVSADYLLGLDETASISVKGLREKEVAALLSLISCFLEKR